MHTHDMEVHNGLTWAVPLPPWCHRGTATRSRLPRPHDKEFVLLLHCDNYAGFKRRSATPELRHRCLGVAGW